MKAGTINRFAAALLTLMTVICGFPDFNAKADELVQIIRYSENFDSAAAPAVPAGWTVSSTGNGSDWITSTDGPFTAPNAAFAPSPATTSSSTLTSPPILVTGATTLLNFQHRFAMETTWDGGVLEISFDGGPFQDIIAAGGTFLAGGYNNDLNPSTNPLSGRRGWSGATQNGFNPVSVRLPANSFGRILRFRWIIGTNDSFGVDGWRIDAVTVETVPTGANPAALSIPETGSAVPYPSEIAVTGLTGFVTGVSVTLDNLTHRFPDDLDVMLVAPNGRKVVLMSDAGGGNPVADIDLTFADSATASLSDGSQLSGGLFKPTNYDTADVFPPPAPQTPIGSSTLAGFYGSNPNGNWQLFVVDDSGGNGGAISGGWSLDIQTSVNACLFDLSPSAQAFGATGGNGAFQIGIPAGCAWSASSGSGFVALNSPVSGEGAGAISYSVAPNQSGARTGLITVTAGLVSRTFQAQQSSGCPTSVSQNTLNIGSGGGPANIGVAAGAGCSWSAVPDVAWITAPTAPQTGNGTAQMNVAANPARNSRSATVTVGAQTLTVNQAGTPATRFDFDGDGRADISVFRSGVWYLLQSSAGFAARQFGIAADVVVPADYDADGRTDLAVYRNGVWYVNRSSDSQTTVTAFGIAGDVPVPADLDGDGRAELAVYRSGAWYALNPATSQLSVYRFGLAGDRPIVGDYDGDGKADLAVFRDGTWFISRSSLGFLAVQFGIGTDRPVALDFNGDGRADPAVFREGQWHVLSGFQDYSVTQFGIPGDVPAAGDYDGDGRADPAVYRAGTWFVLGSATGVSVNRFGLAGDLAVPSAFIP